MIESIKIGEKLKPGGMMKRILAIILIVTLFMSIASLHAAIQSVKGIAKVNLRSATLYMDQKKFDKALGFYQKVLVDYPDNIDANKGIGDIYYNIAAEKPDSAIVYYPKASAAYKKALDGFATFTEWKEKESDVAIYDEAVKLHTSCWVKMFKIGQDSYKVDMFDDAIAIYNVLLDMGPDSLKTVRMLAACYSGKNDTEKANQYFGRILEKNPNDVDIIKLLASKAYNSEDYATAYKHYEKLMSIDPKEKDYPLYAAYCKTDLKELDKASVLFDKAIALDPTNVDAIATAADIARTLNNLPKAMELYKKLLALQKTAENYQLACFTFLEAKDFNSVVTYGQEWYNNDNTSKEAVQLIINAAGQLKNKALADKWTAIYRNMK